MKLRIDLGSGAQKRSFHLLMLVATSGFCCVFLLVTGVTAASSQDAKAVAKSSRDFGVDLFNGLRKKEAGNLFFSPFSVHTAFGMVFAGAGSSTKDEMANVMRFSSIKSSNGVHAGFKELLGEIKGDGNVTLETANRVYVQENFKISDEYLKTVREFYLSDAEKANFTEDGQSVKINSWVEEQTKRRIKDLLPPDSLDSLTRLVVVNAIYFKGNWEEQFDPKQTSVLPFYLTNSSTVEVPMMQRRANFDVYDVEELPAADVVEIPYKGERTSMILIIPKEIGGLKEVESKLRQDVLEKIMSSEPKDRELRLYLPKFKLESSFELKQPLSELGMRRLFDEKSADLSGITGDRSLYMSEGFHKAFLEVNEEGSEAAAATAGIGSTRMGSFAPTTVKADRPFLVLIRKKVGDSDTLLFMGRVANPV